MDEKEAAPPTTPPLFLDPALNPPKKDAPPDTALNPILPVVPLPSNPAYTAADRSRIATAPPEFVVLNRINPAVFQAGTVTRRESRDDLATDRLRKDRFVFHPGLQKDLYYNSNFFGSNSNERESYLLNTTPSFGLEYDPNDNIKVVAAGLFTQHEYLKDVSPDYFDASASGGIKIDRFFTDGLSFTLNNDYQQVGGSVVSPLAETRDLNNLEIVTGERYHTNTTPATVSFKSDRVDVRMTYAYKLIDYFSRDNDADDDNQHEIALNGDYSILSKRLIAFTDFSFARTRYPSDNQSDFDFSHSDFGFKGKLAGLDYLFHGGVARQELLKTNSDQTEAIYGGSLHYAYKELIDVRVFGERDFTAGVRTGGSLSTTAGGVIEFKTNPHSSLTLSHVYENRDRQGLKESTASSTASFRYRFGPRMESVTSFNYLKELLDSDRQETKLFSQAVNYRVGQRSTLSAAFSYEDRDRVDGSERITVVYSLTYAYNFTSYANFRAGLNRSERDDSRSGADFSINEAHLGIQLSW